MNDRNLTWHRAEITRADREQLLKQRGCVLWMTGLSGSGKSTVAQRLATHLYEDGRAAYVLDGDNVRHGLNRDLGFSAEDRKENIRRLSELAALFADAGLITITAFISPFCSDRAAARDIIGPEHFVEVFLDVPVDVCESRDPKNLYHKARAGEIQNFTGISSPYEAPENPEIRLPTHQIDVDDCARQIMTYLSKNGYIPTAGNIT